jgi:hypothetical protein
MSIANRKPVCDCLIVDDSVGGERLSPLSSRGASTHKDHAP